MSAASIGGLLAYPEKLGLTFWVAFVPEIAFLWAMWLSLVSRAPIAQPVPLSIQESIRQAHKSQTRSEYPLWMCVSLHVACEYLEIVNDFKARMVNYAGRTVVVGVILTIACAGFISCQCNAKPVHHPFPNSEQTTQKSSDVTGPFSEQVEKLPVAQ